VIGSHAGVICGKVEVKGHNGLGPGRGAGEGDEGAREHTERKHVSQCEVQFLLQSRIDG
jgi:hypothetical protein